MDVFCDDGEEEMWSGVIQPVRSVARVLNFYQASLEKENATEVLYQFGEFGVLEEAKE